MSDYSSTYNGATKDATNATILASAIQTELDSISTAIATKADVAASPIANEIPITTSSGDLTNSGVYASGGAIRDSSGNEVIIPTGVASAINEVTVVNAATTANPRIQSSGEADTGLIIADSNDNEVIIAESVASAVNEVTVTNAATGNKPSINQTGSEDVGLDIEGVSIVNGVMTGISAATITTLTSTTSNIGTANVTTAIIDNLTTTTTAGTTLLRRHTTSSAIPITNASYDPITTYHDIVSTTTFSTLLLGTSIAAGTLRVYYTTNATSASQVNLRIAIDGVSVATYLNNNGGLVSTFSDITVAAGDIVTLQVYVVNAGGFHDAYNIRTANTTGGVVLI